MTYKAVSLQRDAQTQLRALMAHMGPVHDGAHALARSATVQGTTGVEDD
ncbi:MAG: hypothetical protein GXP16_01490 [Gammaproteobacteria bacterium]|nr:hypothetical protein [Gammaproteobacteria bacterium]